MSSMHVSVKLCMCECSGVFLQPMHQFHAAHSRLYIIMRKAKDENQAFATAEEKAKTDHQTTPLLFEIGKHILMRLLPTVRIFSV